MFSIIYCTVRNPASGLQWIFNKAIYLSIYLSIYLMKMKERKMTMEERKLQLEERMMRMEETKWQLLMSQQAKDNLFD